MYTIYYLHYIQLNIFKVATMTSLHPRVLLTLPSGTPGTRKSKSHLWQGRDRRWTLHETATPYLPRGLGGRPRGLGVGLGTVRAIRYTYARVIFCGEDNT